MRPLTLAERGVCTPTVSLARLLDHGVVPDLVAGHCELELRDYTAEIPADRRAGHSWDRGATDAGRSRTILLCVSKRRDCQAGRSAPGPRPTRAPEQAAIVLGPIYAATPAWYPRRRLACRGGRDGRDQGR